MSLIESLISHISGMSLLTLAPALALVAFTVSRAFRRHYADYFRGGRCVVTGAASGIGRALVQTLLAIGCEVIAVDRNVASLKPQDRLHLLEIDLLELDAADRMVAAVHKAFSDGAVDLWCINAGVCLLGGWDSANMTARNLRNQATVNMSSPMETMSALAQRFKEHKQERPMHLLFTGSVSGKTPFAGVNAYAASKAGLMHMAKGLSRDLFVNKVFNFDVKVSTVVPNAVRTSLLSNKTWKTAENLVKVASTEDVAKAMLDGAANEDNEIFISFTDRLMVIMDALFPQIITYAAKYGPDNGVDESPAFERAKHQAPAVPAQAA